FFIWIWLLITVFSDIFRSPDLSGWSKGIWTIFVILVPYLGVFVYLIARGHKMNEHAIAQAQARDAQMRAYVQDVTASSGSAGSTERGQRGDARRAGAHHPRGRRRPRRQGPRPHRGGPGVLRRRRLRTAARRWRGRDDARGGSADRRPPPRVQQAGHLRRQ